MHQVPSHEGVWFIRLVAEQTLRFAFVATIVRGGMERLSKRELGSKRVVRLGD